MEWWRECAVLGALVAGFSGVSGSFHRCCRSEVVTSLVWGLLRRAALAEGGAASASFWRDPW